MSNYTEYRIVRVRDGQIEPTGDWRKLNRKLQISDRRLDVRLDCVERERVAGWGRARALGRIETLWAGRLVGSYMALLA